MKSAAWYEAHSYCPDGEPHEGTPIETLDGEFVGWICANCLERVNRVRRGSDLWVVA